MWGTDNEWLYVANHFPDMTGYDSLNENNCRERLVSFLDTVPDKRSYAKILMTDHGIWEQAVILAKSMDLNIQP